MVHYHTKKNTTIIGLLNTVDTMKLTPLSEFLAQPEAPVLSKSWIGIKDRKGKVKIYELWYRKPNS